MPSRSPSDIAPEPAQPPTAAPKIARAPNPPVDAAAARRAHEFVQNTLTGGPLADDPRVHIVPIEDASGAALTRFHSALRKLEHPEARAKVRIAWYGSSSVSADRYTGYLRGYLQHRFGDGGVGYVAIVPLWKWHRHNEVSLQTRGAWVIEHAQKKTGRQDGQFGLLGASASASSKRLRTELTARAGGLSPAAESARVELYFLAQPGGGHFTLEAGNARPQTVATAAPGARVGRFRVDGAPPRLPVRVRPKGDGEVRLFGAVLEREGAGVVVDALGLGGSRAANHLMWDEPLWREQIQERAPALYVLAYGANEAVDEDEPITVYESGLRSVLDRFSRALPEASCLLVGPVDFPVRDETTKAWVGRPRIDQIIGAQRQIADEHGCGFWDTRGFMGGAGTMDAWASLEPALAKSDHLHFTSLGYFHLGRALADALMAGYDAPAG